MVQRVLLDIGLAHYLVVSAALFALGTVVIVVRRNAVAVLFGVEMVLNAAGINFVAFSRFAAGDRSGHIITIFVIILAAAEAAVALAIILNLFHQTAKIEADEADLLQR